MKILINTPDLTKYGGGVTNHYKGLFPYWKLDINYNPIGKRKGIPSLIILIYDYVKFFFICAFRKYDFILLNPSLGKKALMRDSWFLKISKWFKIKTFVFIHGWNEKLAQEITEIPNHFLRTYQRADGFLVLASSFKTQMKNWGITKPIFLTTTKVDDDLVKSVTIKEKKSINTLLFLARVEENKGVIIAIKALQILHAKFPDLKLNIAGGGDFLKHVKEFVKTKGIQNVDFLGNISGNKLIKTFSDSDIYILPTWHGEGMPTSVLEAMAFGLPIISRPVGGLVDFFEEDKMGYLIESLEPEEYAKKIILLLENKGKIEEIGRYNHEYANRYFLASKVTLKLEQIITDKI